MPWADRADGMAPRATSARTMPARRRTRCTTAPLRGPPHRESAFGFRWKIRSPPPRRNRVGCDALPERDLARRQSGVERARERRVRAGLKDAHARRRERVVAHVELAAAVDLDVGNAEPARRVHRPRA